MNFSKFSPAMFGLILIGFLLPFVSLNCSGTSFQQFTGMDLALGKNLHSDDPSMNSKMPPNQKHIVQEFWALIALAAAIVGMVISVSRAKNRYKILALCGAAVAASLLLLMAKISSELNSGEYAGAFQAEYLFGYHLTLLVSLGVGALNGFYFFNEKSKA
jgi:hypothetical protein